MILARRMMKTFALGLGAEENYFDSTVTATYTSILLNYYPPQAPDGDDPESLIAHSDFESMSMSGFILYKLANTLKHSRS